MDNSLYLEKNISQQPAIDLLRSMGYTYISPQDCEAQRGNRYHVLLKDILRGHPGHIPGLSIYNLILSSRKTTCHNRPAQHAGLCQGNAIALIIGRLHINVAAAYIGIGIFLRAHQNKRRFYPELPRTAHQFLALRAVANNIPDHLAPTALQHLQQLRDFTDPLLMAQPAYRYYFDIGAAFRKWSP